MKPALVALAALGLGAGAAADPPARDATPASAREILGAAFDNYYGCDTRAELELRIGSKRGGERTRVLDVATKQIEGMRRGLARLTAPAHLRGMSFLMIENAERSHDTFVYLPSQRRVRRISTAQKDDAFVGSDLSYEDMERRRVEDYDVELRPGEQVDGEAVHVVSARPRIHDAYERVEVLVAERDRAMLGLRFFRPGADTPYRIMRMPRDGMLSQKGYVLPTRIDIESLKRGTTTRVTFRHLEINPELEDHLFAPSWLERDRSFRPATTP